MDPPPLLPHTQAQEKQASEKQGRQKGKAAAAAEKGKGKPEVMETKGDSPLPIDTAALKASLAAAERVAAGE